MIYTTRRGGTGGGGVGSRGKGHTGMLTADSSVAWQKPKITL